MMSLFELLLISTVSEFTLNICAHVLLYRIALYKYRLNVVKVFFVSDIFYEIRRRFSIFHKNIPKPWNIRNTWRELSSATIKKNGEFGFGWKTIHG